MDFGAGFDGFVGRRRLDGGYTDGGLAHGRQGIQGGPSKKGRGRLGPAPF